MSENRNGLLAEDSGAEERESRDDLLAAGLRAAADLIGEAHDDPTEWDFEALDDGTIFGAPRPTSGVTDGLHVSRDLADALGEERVGRYGVHVLESLADRAWLLVEGGKVLAGGVATTEPQLRPRADEAPDGLAVSRRFLDLIDGVPRHEPAEGQPVLIRPANATGWKFFGELAAALGAMRLSVDEVEVRADRIVISAEVTRQVKDGRRSVSRTFALEDAEAAEGAAHPVACEMFLELGEDR